MNETVLISTFYSFQPLVASAHAFSPKKIILILAEDSLKNEKVSQDIEKVKDVYGKVAVIEIIKVKGADLLDVAEKTVDLLEKLKEELNRGSPDSKLLKNANRFSNDKLIVNVSGGWKLLSQGVMYGCYARPELVSKIICNSIEDNSIVELPKLGFGLSTAKRELLEEISKRNGKSISEIAQKMEKTRGMLYQHLKELKESGYVDEKFEITLAGRMGLL